MNWTSLVADLAVAMFGAGLTLGVALVTYFRQLRLRNRQLVHNLADDLATRRAFSDIEPRVHASDDEDAVRCFRSVQAARGRIAEVRDQISPNSSLRSTLQLMVVGCVRYKQAVEQDPSRWQFALMRLRDELRDGVRALERETGLAGGSLPNPGEPLPPL